MNIQSQQQHSANDQPAWKTEEYRGKRICVRVDPRAVENQTLSGHGQQWAFAVKIIDIDAGPMSEPDASATSDLELFYSTQAIAEDMGFLKGRELIEGVLVASAVTPLR